MLAEHSCCDGVQEKGKREVDELERKLRDLPRQTRNAKDVEREHNSAVSGGKTRCADHTLTAHIYQVKALRKLEADSEKRNYDHKISKQQAEKRDVDQRLADQRAAMKRMTFQVTTQRYLLRSLD